MFKKIIIFKSLFFLIHLLIINDQKFQYFNKFIV
jgi:hypothetical protein